jgi:hypothetical protein
VRDRRKPNLPSYKKALLTFHFQIRPHHGMHEVKAGK